MAASCAHHCFLLLCRDKYVDKVNKVNMAIENRLDNVRRRMALQLAEDEALGLEGEDDGTLVLCDELIGV
jgi:hypothetical protein